MAFDFEMDWNCNSDKTYSSLCNLNKTNNMWYQNNHCRLDDLTYGQVYYVLTRNPNAKRDLLKITDDRALIELANKSGLLMDEKEENAQSAARINNPKHTLPFYTLFRGNTTGGK